MDLRGPPYPHARPWEGSLPNAGPYGSCLEEEEEDYMVFRLSFMPLSSGKVADAGPARKVPRPSPRGQTLHQQTKAEGKMKSSSTPFGAQTGPFRPADAPRPRSNCRRAPRTVFFVAEYRRMRIQCPMPQGRCQGMLLRRGGKSLPTPGTARIACNRWPRRPGVGLV